MVFSVETGAWTVNGSRLDPEGIGFRKDQTCNDRAASIGKDFDGTAVYHDLPSQGSGGLGQE